MDLGALTASWQQLRQQLRVSAHILVVDDEATVCAVLREFLLEGGYRVECVGSAEEAWSRIESDRFDLLVVDKNLPGVSGIDLVARLRDERLALPALLITGYPTLESVDEALEHGAVDYLSKPFDLEHVQTRVAALLEGTSTRRLFEAIVRDLGAAERAGAAEPVAALQRRLWAMRQIVDRSTGVA
ncbi:MAG: response regulator, partial [Myxococcales bacterium]|nr:response regulator [Myxococcales bacterium]